MMTLIATDGVLGLQICKDRNAKPQKWEYVPSIEGALVVNLGDMMQCWSNGLFRYPAIKCSTYLTQRYEEVHANFRSYEKHA
uniref:Isopenicillin N synthase-like Fe(2+) 2OG dioxygenase domain-containing protein n=1 Tax=Brassica campestris TaxID=3711 RepID=M4DCQ7_BRACM